MPWISCQSLPQIPVSTCVLESPSYFLRKKQNHVVMQGILNGQIHFKSTAKCSSEHFRLSCTKKCTWRELLCLTTFSFFSLRLPQHLAMLGLLEKGNVSQIPEPIHVLKIQTWNKKLKMTALFWKLMVNHSIFSNCYFVSTWLWIVKNSVAGRHTFILVWIKPGTLWLELRHRR